MNIIGAVLIRPMMYTVSGAFGEVIAFLEGYASGVAKYDPNFDVVVEWSSFRDWLSSRARVPQSDLFADLREQSGNDAAALAQLRQLYQEFKADTKLAVP